MIYFTKAVDYAIAAMVCMARNPHTSMDVKQLAEAEAIPEVFLAKLLQKLKKAGLITSKRGIGGGFLLDKHPASISMFEIIEAVGGFETQGKRLDTVSELVEKRVWKGLNSLAKDHLTTTTVASLVAYHEGY